MFKCLTSNSFPPYPSTTCTTTREKAGDGRNTQGPLPRWEMQLDFQAPGFNLAQPWRWEMTFAFQINICKNKNILQRKQLYGTSLKALTRVYKILCICWSLPSSSVVSTPSAACLTSLRWLTAVPLQVAHSKQTPDFCHSSPALTLPCHS